MKRISVFFLISYFTFAHADSFDSRFQSTISARPVNSVQFDQQLRHLAAIANTAAISVPGFYSLHDSRIPPQVRRAADAVYLLVIPAQFDSLPRSDVENRANAETDPIKKPIYEKFAAFCDRQKFTLNLCPFPKSFAQGSGFLAGGKGEILWTSAHVFVDLMNDGDKLFPNFVKMVSARRGTLPVFIFDNKMHLVLDPISSPLKFGREIPLDIHFDDGKFSYNSLQDAINLELPMPIGRPIPIAATNTIDKSHSVYSIGYPLETGAPNSTDVLSYDRSPYPNSDGVHEFATIGSFVQLSGDETFSLPNDRLPRRSARDPEFYRVYATNVDGNYRQSGGPLLNDYGDVIAIFTALKINRVSEQPLLRSATSLSLRPDAWE